MSSVSLTIGRVGTIQDPAVNGRERRALTRRRLVIHRRSRPPPPPPFQPAPSPPVQSSGFYDMYVSETRPVRQTRRRAAAEFEPSITEALLWYRVRSGHLTPCPTTGTDVCLCHAAHAGGFSFSSTIPENPSSQLLAPRSASSASRQPLHQGTYRIRNRHQSQTSTGRGRR